MVCVVARNQPSGKVLAAFVQSASPTLAADALRNALVTLLHPAAIPSVFVFLSTLPLTINGKIERQQLKNWPLNDGSECLAQPETETEAILERIVANAIGCPQVDVAQAFINLGAHSLTMRQIVALVARDLCCHLSIADLFHHNTVRKLAEFIENRAVVTECAIAIGKERRAPLSPQQNLLWYLSALNPDDCSYNLPLAIDIQGPLNLARFEQAINFIYEKHESLRTRFAETNGVAYQYAEPHASLRSLRATPAAAPTGCPTSVPSPVAATVRPEPGHRPASDSTSGQGWHRRCPCSPYSGAVRAPEC
ncbi:condensation domain-containing protein [Haematospirillum sp. H4485]|uniref:condensation domain-containing protein n=1 Tax=Haematospirillum sp. H4485 TaxID=2723109 RepID=UPI0039F5025C